MKDSRGFTLIELIIVMAIIGILSMGTIFGIGALGYGDAKSATGRIKSLSDYVRIENMTKKQPYYLVIYQQDNDYYLSIETQKNGSRISTRTEKLDLRKGRISFQNTDGSTYLVSSVPVEGDNVRDKLELEFAKDTGRIKSNYMGEIVKIIYVDCNKRSYKVHLVEATGKAYID